jgi:Tol biopolymer transport system component
MGLIVFPGVRADADSQITAASADDVACGTPTDQGLIVYLDVEVTSTTPAAAGYRSALVVFAPDGTEVHRVELQDFPTIFPLGAGCIVLGNAPNLGSFLFDPVSGTMLRLTVPADYDGDLFPLTGWQRTYREHRWAFLTDNPATHALLVDTQTGTTDDLVALVHTLRGGDGQIVVVLAAALSPDESSFLLMTDRDTWLVPTTDPSRARQLPNAAPGQASFSEDGKRVLYVAATGETTTDVVAENLDGSGREVLAVDGRHASAYWVPGSNGRQVLLIRNQGEHPAAVTVMNGAERELATFPDGSVVGAPMFSPSDRHVVLPARADHTAWFWIDLGNGTSRQLDELDGYAFPYAPYAPGVRWLEFFPSDTPIVQPGTSILGLDLEAGTVTTLLTFDFDTPYAGILQVSSLGSSPDGRYVAVNDLGESYPRFWLLDAEKGTAKQYDGRLAGSFSPDGHNLIVSEPAGAAKVRPWRTLIMSVAGQDLRTLAVSVGRGGVWVPGTHAQ